MNNSNFNVLPMYDSIAAQHHNKSYAYGQYYALYSYNSKLLPFQIVRPQSAAAIQYVKLYAVEGAVMDITAEALGAGLRIQNFGSYDLLINPSVLMLPTLVMPEGRHYIEIADGENTWFSEVFTVVNQAGKLMRIEFQDSQDLEYSGGRIHYDGVFKNYILLDAEIGKPDYPFEEEQTRRNGYTFIEKQVSYKVFKFSFLAPEFLCDVLRLVRMHDYIKINTENGIYYPESIIFGISWQDQGDLAAVPTEFECDTIVTKTGRGLSINLAGDYNADYNNDYNK